MNTSRTSSVVDSKAVTLHRNANGHTRKDPKPVTPLAKDLARERNRKHKSPRHTRPKPSYRVVSQIADHRTAVGIDGRLYTSHKTQSGWSHWEAV